MQVLTMKVSVFDVASVDNLLSILAPRPEEPCPAVKWYDAINHSPSCGICESCKAYDKHLHMHQCIMTKIPKSSEALRLTVASTKIQDAKYNHRNSRPGAIADAIADVKTRYGISSREFKYENLPYLHQIVIAWYSFLFSNRDFVNALTAYLIASWNHASFNMYEIGTEAKMLERKERTFQEMVTIVNILDINVDRVIQQISDTRILRKAYRDYKKLLNSYGFVFVCEEDNEEIDDRKAEITVLTATFLQECDKFQTLQVQFNTMEPAYRELIDACKEDNDKIVTKKKEFRAFECIFLQEREKLRKLQKQLDSLKKKQRKALEKRIQDAERLLAQLEEKF